MSEHGSLETLARLEVEFQEVKKHLTRIFPEGPVQTLIAGIETVFSEAMQVVNHSASEDVESVWGEETLEHFVKGLGSLYDALASIEE